MTPKHEPVLLVEAKRRSSGVIGAAAARSLLGEGVSNR
jgi:hypothetical protein